MQRFSLYGVHKRDYPLITVNMFAKSDKEIHNG